MCRLYTKACAVSYLLLSLSPLDLQLPPPSITMSDVTESSSSIPIVTIWALMIELHATTQVKLGYLTSDTDASDSQDPQFGKWKIVDATATRLKQEGRFVSTYFTKLKAIWLELDKRCPFQMKCTDDMKTFQAVVMVDCVYDFIMCDLWAGLDDSYEKVSSDILQCDKVPSIENVFLMVRREAQRQNTMFGFGTKIGEPIIVFASKNIAMVSWPTWSCSFIVPYRHLTSVEKDKLKCDHCSERRHTIDTCWALHGVPDWEKEWRHLKKEQLGGKAHVADVVISIADVTTGHDHLTATPALVVTVVSSTPTPLAPMRHPSNFGKAFHAHDTCDTRWIID
ncbi:unnamed protein product [Prunus armeniaca]